MKVFLKILKVILTIVFFSYTLFVLYFLGLAPKESADINVVVIKDLPVGEYKSTAVFHSKFANHEATADLIEPVKLNITTNVKN